jgi:hypothetical protein
VALEPEETAVYAACMSRDAAVLDVLRDERYWYPDDGGVVWLAGYQLVDPATGDFLARDSPQLAERGLLVTGVAGAAAHHGAVLASDAASPGATLRLRRDPTNEHDSNAIAVDAADGRGQLGWVPRQIAAEIAPEMDAGLPFSAVVLREQRRSPRDPRHGLTMLVAASPEIDLRTR